MFSLKSLIHAVDAAQVLHCHKFVGAGSQAEYGVVHTAEPWSPDMPCNPVRGDGLFKYTAGKLASILTENYGMDCVWMRVFSVYGIYDRMNSLVMSTIAKLRAGLPCEFTKAEQLWDYLYADDIGQAFYLVGKKPPGSQVYCVGSGIARPLYEYIQTMRDIVAPQAELHIGALPYPAHPIMYLCADISALRRDTGWAPRTSFAEGITRINRAWPVTE